MGKLSRDIPPCQCPTDQHVASHRCLRRRHARAPSRRPRLTADAFQSPAERNQAESRPRRTLTDDAASNQLLCDAILASSVSAARLSDRNKCAACCCCCCASHTANKSSAMYRQRRSHKPQLLLPTQLFGGPARLTAAANNSPDYVEQWGATPFFLLLFRRKAYWAVCDALHRHSTLT